MAGSAGACGGSGAAAGMARLAQGAIVHDREAAAGELGVARLGGDAGVYEVRQDQRLDRIPQSPCRQIRTGTWKLLLKLFLSHNPGAPCTSSTTALIMFTFHQDSRPTFLPYTQRRNGAIGTSAQNGLDIFCFFLFTSLRICMSPNTERYVVICTLNLQPHASVTPSKPLRTLYVLENLGADVSVPILLKIEQNAGFSLVCGD